MQSRIEPLNGSLDEVPKAQRTERARPIRDYEAEAHTRDEAIASAYASGGYSMKEVGTYFGLHYSRVSRIVKSARASQEIDTEAKG